MAKTRPFAFAPGTSNAARLRQRGLCAQCGESLDDELEFGHHVVSNQCGNPSDQSHAWLRTLQNCVALCHECHMRVHQDGHTRDGAVAPPSYFKFSHETAAQHQAWVKDLGTRSQSIWQYLQEKVIQVE
jgi:5-methylcytosine-specific restriction endonuclease McrA